MQMTLQKLHPAADDKGCKYSEGYNGAPRMFHRPLNRTDDDPVHVAHVEVRAVSSASTLTSHLLDCKNSLPHHWEGDSGVGALV